MTTLSEDCVLQIYDGEGKEVSKRWLEWTMCVREKTMIVVIVVFMKAIESQSMFYISGKELEERDSLIKHPEK